MQPIHSPMPRSQRLIPRVAAGAILALLAVPRAGSAEWGTRQSFSFASRATGSAQRVEVLLPPSYGSDPHRRYPVLYLQDGQNLFDRRAMHGGWMADEGMGRAVASGRAREAIIVGVHCGPRRTVDYTPSVDPEEGCGGGAGRTLRFLVDELKPWVDRSFRTARDREHTALGGSSLGGLFSLWAGLKRPDVFGGVIAMSPSLWWNHRELLGEIRGGPTPRCRIYLDSGGRSDGKQNTDDCRDLLAGKGLRFGRELWHWSEPSHEHTESAWRDRFPRAFTALFPR